MTRWLEMYQQQAQFNELLRDHRDHPDFPLDLNCKESQQFLKMLAHECMTELFEANLLLKNSKKHRKTDIAEFDREAYKEELVDVLHYFLGIAIYSGITADELFNAYMQKGRINVERLKSGY